MRALEPARSSMGSLETCGCREHARGVAAPHHSRVSEHVGETAPARTGSVHPGERPMHHFANEGHSVVAETAQGFKGDRAESVTWTIVVPEVVVQFVLVPAPGSGTGLLAERCTWLGAKGWMKETSPKT
jgi:hypothetical protein